MTIALVTGPFYLLPVPRPGCMNSCEQLYPGYNFYSAWNSFRVLKGIVFDETLASEHVLDLVEVSKVGSR
jgi:hypothetical protein